VLREQSEQLKVEFLNAFRTIGTPASEIGFLTAATVAASLKSELFPACILALGAIESAADYAAIDAVLSPLHAELDSAIASEESARHAAAERAAAANAAVLARKLQLEQDIEADPQLHKLRELAAAAA
jgi:hypothetical protein